ncbi:MAG: hypothetical protein M1814_003352 [Vezdaea aestivalis]|nr:MAG: hypothetical protein M1814_003352 [Vezdaea aestivalis]
MDLQSLPSELLLQIFHSLPTVSSALALSQTSHRLHALFKGPQHLSILFSAISTEYSPIGPALQLATYNGTHTTPSAQKPPLSQPLLTSLLHYGRTASRWAALYPAYHWCSEASSSRRLLSPSEAHSVRRGIYRIWLYTQAFHTPSHPRTSRRNPPVVRTRAVLLRPWPVSELAELLDVRELMRRVIAKHVCPPDSKVRKHLLLRDPGADLTVYPPATLGGRAKSHGVPLCLRDAYHSQCLGIGNQRVSARGVEDGWGDELTQYYAVQDMLKLDPQRVLWLAGEGWMGRSECREWIEEELGEWFENNGETIGETLEFVLDQRGMEWVEVCELKEAVEAGELGCVHG